MSIDITKRTDAYEPYPGASTASFADEFINGKQITLMAFCKNERIDPASLPRLVSEVLTEWELTEAAHATRRDAMTHMINHIRIKIRNERRNDTARRPGASGRGQHRNPTPLDLARRLLGGAPD